MKEEMPGLEPGCKGGIVQFNVLFDAMTHTSPELSGGIEPPTNRLLDCHSTN